MSITKLYIQRYLIWQKIASDNNLKPGGCARKLNEALDQGLDIEEAVDFASENQNNTPVEYLGKKFESLTALSKHLNLHIMTLKQRINKGWPEHMWGCEKLPIQSPDFYFAIDNPETCRRPCSVYSVELRRFKTYQKIGVAASPTHRRDAEYGEENYVKTFDNRLEALIFEGAILACTQSYEGYPDQLLPPHRKVRWHGVTELRKITWEELQKFFIALEVQLDTQGFEDLALRYIPMSERQQTQLSHALVVLENKKSG